MHIKMVPEAQKNNVAVGTNALWYGNGNGNVSIGANSNYKSESMKSFINSTTVSWFFSIW